MDLVVRDARGRSLGFASAGCQVAWPIAMESWQAEEAFYRRGDRAVMLAGFDNQSAPREVRLETGLYDMYGRLVASETKKLTIAAGKSRQKVDSYLRPHTPAPPPPSGSSGWSARLMATAAPSALAPIRLRPDGAQG
ncbi:MAG: hypothetical protein ACOX1P_15050 [Thermoguttaceae bacterium]